MSPYLSCAGSLSIRFVPRLRCNLERVASRAEKIALQRLDRIASRAQSALTEGDSSKPASRLLIEMKETT